MFWKFYDRYVAGRRLAPVEPLLMGAWTVPLLLIRNPRARRYLLRLRPDGTARVTIPRGGNPLEARLFVERSRGWLETQLQRLQAQTRLSAVWQVGTEVLFRGEKFKIETADPGHVWVATEMVKVKPDSMDLRPEIESHLRQLATRELALRVKVLAAAHGLTVQRVSVRNQKSRWGSCSRRGTISLNWRLIQTPGFVSDYIILHELAHLRHMNHSRLFWEEVGRLCPDYQVAEQWLKANRLGLR